MGSTVWARPVGHVIRSSLEAAFLSLCLLSLYGLFIFDVARGLERPRAARLAEAWARRGWLSSKGSTQGQTAAARSQPLWLRVVEAIGLAFWSTCLALTQGLALAGLLTSSGGAQLIYAAELVVASLWTAYLFLSGGATPAGINRTSRPPVAGAGPRTSARRLARAATVIVPAAIGITLFLYAWLRDTVSGAGLSEENRPIAIIMLSAFGAACWVLGTSTLFAVHRPASRLPRPARLLALYLLRGPTWIAAHEPGLRRGQPVIPPLAGSLSTSRLISLAIFELPLFLVLAPFVLGLAVQPGVYRPAEAAAAAAMGGAVVAWSAFLASRSWPPRQGDGEPLRNPGLGDSRSR